MACSSPGGLGPWFVALLFNTSDESKKQTHLVAHTLPHLATDILNKATASDKKSYWVIMAKVGPFENWADCIAYLNLWTFRTRGRKKRLERGIELWEQFRHKLGLTLWAQTNERDTILEAVEEERQGAHAKPVALVPRKRKVEVRVSMDEMDCAFKHDDKITIDTIKKMQIKKKVKT